MFTTKMVSRALLFVIIIFLLRGVSCENNDDSIFEEIQKEYNDFEKTQQQRFVVILGTSGTGKSTLGLLLAGANLTSIEVSSGVYAIKDNNDLIGGASITVSKTKVPNVMIDKTTNTTFYDCPGFADSRGVVTDIASTRSIRDLLNFSKEIKLLFTLSYESVTLTGNRHGFTNLAKHITNLIKNIDKYRKGISLVVTKVTNLIRYNEETGKVTFIEDETIINDIGIFFNQTKSDLENKRATNLTFKEQQVNDGAIKLCEIFLERDLNEYTRINIFRYANMEGNVQNMKSIKKERLAIDTTLHNTMEYVQTNSMDFGYSISDESKGHVAHFINKLEYSLEKYADHICTDLKSFYNKGTSLINGVKSTINFFQLPSNMEFIRHFNQSVHYLGIEINSGILKNLSTNIDFLDFLQHINNNHNPPISKRMESRLTICATDLLGSVKSQLQLNVPEVILGIQKSYIDQDENNLPLLNTLRNFFTNGLTSEINTTVLRSLLPFTSHQQFSRNLEFFDFVQLIRANKYIQISDTLRACYKDAQDHLYSTFASYVHYTFATIKTYYSKQESQLKEIAMPRIRDINTISVESFANDLFSIVDDLGLKRNESKILRDLEYVHMLMLNRNTFVIPEAIIADAHAYRNYFNDLEVWYTVLRNLRDHVLTYTAQLNNTFRNEGPLQFINDNTINASSTWDENHGFRLQAVQRIWSQAMSNFTYSCQPNRLLVQGHVVALSNVVTLDCWQTAKVVNIFALNKIFIDVDIDKSGENFDISIISPKWEVLPREQMRKINMQGKEGERLDKQSGQNGEHGLPGKPGGTGGRFFGIGHSFSNSDLLIIDVSGGDGSSGQDGERGPDGIEGESPSRDINKIDLRQCFSDKSGNRGAIFGFCYGKNGTRGGKGGDGGCSGIGGFPGKVSLVGLNEIPRVRILNSTGERGSGGIGGLGGKETRNGPTAYVKVVYMFEWAGASHLDFLHEIPGSVIPAGNKGGFATNCRGIEKPTNVSLNPSRSITAYQEYARENLANYEWRSNLEHLLNGLTNNVTFDSFFDILDLIEEYNSLEKQYFHLHKKIDFVPFYQSLKNRIERNIKRFGKSNDEQKSAKMLYAAIITKLLVIRKETNEIVVSKLLTYAGTIKRNIAKIDKVKKAEYVSELRDQYKRSLDEKIKSANEMVQNMVVSAIDKIFEDTELDIQNLLNEAVVKHKETEDALNIAKENKEKLKTAMIFQNMLAPIKFMGNILAFAGPQAAVAGAAISGGATIVESIVDGGLQPKKISVTVVPYKNLIRKITATFMRHQLLFTEQLNDLAKIINETNSTDFNEIRNVVSATTKKIHSLTKVDARNVTNQIEGFKKGIVDALSATKTHFEKLKKNEKDVNVTKNFEKPLAIINQAEISLKVVNVGVDIYKRNRNDNSKLNEINAQIANYEDQIQTWIEYEESIKTIMLPQLLEMQSSFDKASKTLSGKTHVQLDITKWKMQSALSDLKKLFREMAKAQESLLEGDLLHYIEKINEGIATMITVYDRIDSYAEQSKLAALISNVAIGVTDIGNTKLQNAMFNLDKIVKTNLVLERFESLMLALKQHKFPYAQHYLGAFDKFQPNLQSNDTSAVIKFVTSNIDALIDELETSESTLKRTDNQMFSNLNFDSSQPFYTWHHQDYDIKQLLRGDQITLQSDITRGLNFTAVKFKKISINLKLENQRRQTEFDAHLEKFEIVMTIVGNNYYRCNSRIYYIPMEEDVKFIFHIRNGTVVDENDIVRKIATSDYFLSPYTVWTIQLRFSDFNVFKSLKNEKINLQLTGSGQIMKEEVFGVCNNDLDKYYTFDGKG